MGPGRKKTVFCFGKPMMFATERDVGCFWVVLLYESGGVGIMAVDVKCEVLSGSDWISRIEPRISSQAPPHGATLLEAFSARSSWV